MYDIFLNNYFRGKIVVKTPEYLESLKVIANDFLLIFVLIKDVV